MTNTFKIMAYIAVNMLVCLIIFLLFLVLAVALALALILLIITKLTMINASVIAVFIFLFTLTPAAVLGVICASVYFDEFFGTTEPSDRFKKNKKNLNLTEG